MKAESDPSDIKERMLVFRNENAGNFHNGCKGERYGLAHIAWAVIVAPASMVFPTTFITGQHSGSRSFCSQLINSKSNKYKLQSWKL